MVLTPFFPCPRASLVHLRRNTQIRFGRRLQHALPCASVSGCTMLQTNVQSRRTAETSCRAGGYSSADMPAEPPRASHEQNICKGLQCGSNYYCIFCTLCMAVVWAIACWRLLSAFLCHERCQLDLHVLRSNTLLLLRYWWLLATGSFL